MGMPLTDWAKRGRPRQAAVRAGVRVEWATVGWMAIEAVVAIGAGLMARSVLLTAFGLDSVVELVTGGVLLWRLTTEAHGHPAERVEPAERQAAWIAGIGLALVCGYIVASTAASLATRTHPDASLPGLLLAIAAVVGMPVLAGRKRLIAREIGSAALRGDAACSITCAYMALTLLIGLGLNAAFGWWWADDVAALGLLFWVGREAREALEAARAGHGGCGCGEPACAVRTAVHDPE